MKKKVNKPVVTKFVAADIAAAWSKAPFADVRTPKTRGYEYLKAVPRKGHGRGSHDFVRTLNLIGE